MLTLLAGPSCSGKSSIVKCIPGRVIEFDDWVVERFGGTFEEAMAGYCTAYPGSCEEFLQHVVGAARSGDVVMVDPYVRRQDRIDLLVRFRGEGIAPLHLVYLATGLGAIQRRLEGRPSRRDEQSVYRLYAMQEFPLSNEGWDSVNIVGTG